MHEREAVKSAVEGRTRKEGRLFASEPVELSNYERSGKGEPTITQNISPRGARVATQRVWEPGTFLKIKSMRSNFKALARVTYWRSFSSSRFAIGLEFLIQEGAWPTST